MNPIQTGTRITDATVTRLVDGKPQAVNVTELFAGRKVVLFALPGAFTPTCSAAHLPRYEELHDAFRAEGVDAIYCSSVNDAFVMDAWGRAQHVDKVELLADGNGELTRACGLLVDRSDLGFGPRAWRHALVIDDGVVTHTFIEPDVPGDPYGESTADNVLKTIAPDRAEPPAIALVSRAGCGHCERAREALRTAGFGFEEIRLDGAVTSQSLRALSGATTTPQVFVDGQCIGGADEIVAWVERSANGTEAGTTA